MTIVDAANVNIQTPPVSIPPVGTLLLLGNAPTGVFTGYAGHIAIVTLTGYTFIATNALTSYFTTELGRYKPTATFDGWEPAVEFTGSNVNREILAANKTLAITDPYHQVLDVNGVTRDVELPALGANPWSFAIRALSTTHLLNVTYVDGTLQTLTSLQDLSGSPYLVNVLYDGVELHADIFTKV